MDLLHTSGHVPYFNYRSAVYIHALYWGAPNVTAGPFWSAPLACTVSIIYMQYPFSYGLVDAPMYTVAAVPVPVL